MAPDVAVSLNAARSRAAGSGPLRWLWLVLPAVMLYHIPSEKWVQAITSIGPLHLQTSELSLACFAVFGLVAASWSQFRMAWRSGFAWPWLIYLGALAISTAFAIDRQIALIQDTMVLAAMLLALTVWLTVATADQLRSALAVVAIGGLAITVAIVVLVAYSESTMPHPCPDSGLCLGGSLNLRAAQIGGRLYARAEIPGVDYNRTGMELVLGTLAALYLARTSVGRARWFWTLTSLIVCGGMLLTFSKGALVSIGFGVAVLLLARWYRIAEVSAASVAIVGGLGVTGLLAPIAIRTLSILSFIPAVNRTLVSQGTLDTSDRVVLAQASLDFFRARPIVGVGPLNLQNIERVQGSRVSEHNEYVRALAETGAIGFAALLILLATPMAMMIGALRTRRQLEDRDRLAGHLLLAGLVALIVNFLVAPIDYSYWVWVGFTGAWLARCAPDVRLISMFGLIRARSEPVARAPLAAP